MHRAILSLTAVLTLIWASAARAEHFLVYASGSKALLAIDADAVKADGDHRLVWKLVANREPFVAYGHAVAYMMSREDFDCRNDTVGVTYIVSFGLDGTSLGNEHDVGSEPVIPGSNNAAVEHDVCGSVPLTAYPSFSGTSFELFNEFRRSAVSPSR